jgi:rod shape-determining protein MreC
MFKQQHYFALGAVTLVAVLILSLPANATSRLRLVVSSWFLPLFGLASSAQQLPADLADSALPRRELLNQINLLRRQNEELLASQSQAIATIRENDQLRALLGWQKQLPWQLKPAKVIARDPANWWHTVQIDFGSRDGARVNLPILTPEGYLVGRIASVGYYSSQVVLVGDNNCRVSIIIDNPVHDMGVLMASGPLDDSIVELGYVSGSINIKAGENVATSGLGGTFPKGIPVGKIVDFQSLGFGLDTEARVQLYANLSALEHVWVLFPRI